MYTDFDFIGLVDTLKNQLINKLHVGQDVLLSLKQINEYSDILNFKLADCFRNICLLTIISDHSHIF